MKIVTGYDYMAVWQMWFAYDDSTYDEGSPVGYGATRQEAIDNLLEQLEEIQQ